MIFCCIFKLTKLKNIIQNQNSMKVTRNLLTAFRSIRTLGFWSTWNKIKVYGNFKQYYSLFFCQNIWHTSLILTKLLRKQLWCREYICPNTTVWTITAQNQRNRNLNFLLNRCFILAWRRCQMIKCDTSHGVGQEYWY